MTQDQATRITRLAWLGNFGLSLTSTPDISKFALFPAFVYENKEGPITKGPFPFGIFLKPQSALVVTVPLVCLHPLYIFARNCLFPPTGEELE